MTLSKQVLQRCQWALAEGLSVYTRTIYTNKKTPSTHKDTKKCFVNQKQKTFTKQKSRSHSE